MEKQKRELIVEEKKARNAAMIKRLRAARGDTRTDEERDADWNHMLGMISREEGEARIKELEAGPPAYTEENGVFCRTVTKEELIARVRYNMDHPKRWDER